MQKYKYINHNEMIHANVCAQDNNSGQDKLREGRTCPLTNHLRKKKAKENQCHFKPKNTCQISKTSNDSFEEPK